MAEGSTVTIPYTYVGDDPVQLSNVSNLSYVSRITRAAFGRSPHIAMSESIPTSTLTAEGQMKTFRDDPSLMISALVRTIDHPESGYDTRLHAIRALAKLAENATLFQEIAGTALASVSEWIRTGIKQGGQLYEYWSQCIEVAGALYQSLQRHISVAPATPTAPTDSGPAPVARAAACDVDDWELASSS
ncbi:hypothetical protein M408DRAFT_24099 [Serendipita vermifera MAFF 305830]|uniref:Uncharacterized protein n=1 Tax=Serendipita vermifera MAFF 305830 TaxID=933852 RepID=A0A0C2WPC9_SERVB|nr:hypothetical protein M408DRAFT_24099 [Serendipita vermifera MAFF 305830]